MIILWLLQIVIVIIVPKLKSARSLNTKNLLKIVVILQYIPRVLRIHPLYREVTRSSGILTETAWAGAALNLFLYMLASHVSILKKFMLFSCFIFKMVWSYKAQEALWYYLQHYFLLSFFYLQVTHFFVYSLYIFCGFLSPSVWESSRMEVAACVSFVTFLVLWPNGGRFLITESMLRHGCKPWTKILSYSL